MQKDTAVSAAVIDKPTDSAPLTPHGVESKGAPPTPHGVESKGKLKSQSQVSAVRNEAHGKMADNVSDRMYKSSGNLDAVNCKTDVPTMIGKSVVNPIGQVSF